MILRTETLNKSFQVILTVLVFFFITNPVLASGKSEQPSSQGSTTSQTSPSTVTMTGSQITTNTVTDGIGRTVSVTGTPKRIVCLGPAATEILFAIGAGSSVVVRTDFSTFPTTSDELFYKKSGENGVELIPSLGGFDGKTINIETILSFRPDLVIGYNVMHDYLVPSFEEYGIPVFMSNATTIEQVCYEIDAISSLTGFSANGSACSLAIRTEIEELTEKNTSILTDTANPNTTPITVYWEVWNSPYMSIGTDSFISMLIAAAGGTNIFADVTQPYPVVSEESIIARNPDVIFIPSDSPVTVDDVCARNGWQTINAVKNRRIVKIDADITSRAGPRISQAVKLISASLYPEN